MIYRHARQRALPFPGLLNSHPSLQTTDTVMAPTFVGEGRGGQSVGRRLFFQRFASPNRHTCSPRSCGSLGFYSALTPVSPFRQNTDNIDGAFFATDVSKRRS